MSNSQGKLYKGIVVSSEPAKSVVTVNLGPGVDNNIQQVAPNKLSFLAKGWSWNSSNHSPNPHVNLPIPSTAQLQAVIVLLLLFHRIRKV